MSTPFNPNQQPIPGNGQYPVGQQYTQQMPAAGGYQQQGYQQPQQGYYPQGQFQGAPYGGVPEKKKTGPLLRIIAGRHVGHLIAGVAIWALTKDDSSNDEASASPSASSSAAPTSAPSAVPSPPPPAPPPPPTPPPPPPPTPPPPPPPQGTGSSGSVSSDEEYGVMTECKSALSQTVQKGTLQTWTVVRDGVDSSGRPQYQANGQFNGTLLTGKSGTFNFTCTALYHQDKGVYEAWASIDAY